MSTCMSPIVARQSIGRVAGLVLAALLALAATAGAQNLTSGSIDGVVTDESGGAMPGVTVTATSRALQVPNVTSVTDARRSLSPDRPAAGDLSDPVRAAGVSTAGA